MPSCKNARLIFPMRPGCLERRWPVLQGTWAIGAALLLGGFAPVQAHPGGDPSVPSGPHLVLERRQRLLLVLEGGRERRRFPVGIGRPGWETPVGHFEVIELARNPTWEHPVTGQRIPPGPANPLGSRWIGFHRDCKGRSGFNGQEQLVIKGCVSAGFHGTPQRTSVGQAVSHGCVRLLDEHVRELFELVEMGTPVTVLP